eukprot:580041-Prymnesium_polylepis.1
MIEFLDVAIVAALICTKRNTHDGKSINLFRAIPLPGPPPVAGTLSTLEFSLQYDRVDAPAAQAAQLRCEAAATPDPEHCPPTIAPRWSAL